MSNIKFDKRVDKWQDYRLQIETESAKQWYNDKNIKSIINSINAIDKNILKDIDNERIELAEVSLIDGSNEKIEDVYKSLKFDIPAFNYDYLNALDNEYKNIQQINQTNYILDANNKILIDNLPIYRDLENNDVSNIKKEFEAIEKEIQFFPKKAKEKYIKIDEMIEKIRNKQNFKKIKNKTFQESFNFKWVYWISSISVPVLLLGVVIVVILMLVLR